MAKKSFEISCLTSFRASKCKFPSKLTALLDLILTIRQATCLLNLVEKNFQILENNKKYKLVNRPKSMLVPVGTGSDLMWSLPLTKLFSFGRYRDKRKNEEQLLRTTENFGWISTMRLVRYVTLLTLVCHFFNLSQYFSFHCSIVTNIYPGSTDAFLLS